MAVAKPRGIPVRNPIMRSVDDQLDILQEAFRETSERPRTPENLKALTSLGLAIAFAAENVSATHGR